MSLSAARSWHCRDGSKTRDRTLAVKIVGMFRVMPDDAPIPVLAIMLGVIELLMVAFRAAALLTSSSANLILELFLAVSSIADGNESFISA